MSAKHPVIAVTGSSGAGTTTTSLAFRKIFAQLNLHAARWKATVFTVTRARKWTWRSAKRATPGGISATSAPKLTTSACWNKLSLNTARAAKGNHANICIRTTKPYRGIRCREHSPHGNLYRNPLMYCFMKVYTAAWSHHNITSHSMWIYWLAWCLSLTLEWIQSDPRHQRARALTRSGDGLNSAFNGRLYQLHHAAVFPHPS